MLPWTKQVSNQPYRAGLVSLLKLKHDYHVIKRKKEKTTTVEC